MHFDKIRICELHVLQILLTKHEIYMKNKMLAISMLLLNQYTNITHLNLNLSFINNLQL